MELEQEIDYIISQFTHHHPLEAVMFTQYIDNEKIIKYALQTYSYNYKKFTIICLISTELMNFLLLNNKFGFCFKEVEHENIFLESKLFTLREVNEKLSFCRRLFVIDEILADLC